MATAARNRKSARRRQLEAAINYPIDWIEERSGLIGGLRYFLFRKVPGDTNWFHTLGSATLTAFLVQALTGVILAMYYQPDATVNPATGTSAAYGSIQHITNDLTLGWLVRGMHKWGASVFIILLFFHMARVFLYGAYKYPRELNWIVGVFLLILGMFEGFTGYLLPYDQTAYWATVVGMNITANGPFVGTILGQIMQGGPAIGPETLARYKEDVKKNGKPFYPYAMFHDTVMSLVVVAVIIGLAVIWKWTTPGDHTGTGAGWLGPLYSDQADPGTTSFVPRPDWYFYFLFYLLRIFKWPDSVILGTVGIPTIIMVLMLALPFVDMRRERRLSRRPVAVVITILTVIAMGTLTYKGATAKESLGSELKAAVPGWA